MAGLKQTTFELKMYKDGFTDKFGNIIKGALANCDFYLIDNGVNEKGDLLLSVGPILSIDDKDRTQIVIPKDKISLYLQTKNLTESLIYETMIKNIVTPIANYISATAANMTQEIYAEENKDTDGALINEQLPLKYRKEYAKQYFIDGNFDTPPEIFEALNKTPDDFLNAQGIVHSIGTKLFSTLNNSSKNFTTPEAVVAFRAVTTQTIMNLMDVVEDRKLTTKPFHDGLMTFDGNMEKSGIKA